MKITLQINGEPKECAMLLDALDKIGEEAQKRQLKMSTVTNEMAIEALQAESVKHGKWILNDNGTYSCSVCHSWLPAEQKEYARYCLYCGAKMDKGGEAQKRQLKMSTVTNPCKVETVPTNGPTLMHGVTTGTPLPPQGITETCVKEGDPE